jgi:hypothetical protein
MHFGSTLFSGTTRWLPEDRSVFEFLLCFAASLLLDRGCGQARNYQNKMDGMHRLGIERPEHTLLLRFYSDPPTTTSQRLKGLATGSLRCHFRELARFMIASCV